MVTRSGIYFNPRYFCVLNSNIHLIQRKVCQKKYLSHKTKLIPENKLTYSPNFLRIRLR